MSTAALADDALVARARRADQAAFAELVGRHRRVVWGVCLRITGNPTDAEDALQDALIAAWRNLGAFREQARFSTWLYRIAANAALAVVRRRRPTAEVPEELPAPGRGFEAAVADRDRIGRALRTLPPAFREALVLREYGDLAYAEIAEQQDVPVDTVKSRISRARSMMRTALAAE